ncbi:MAG TPA: aryl-sulfate sulfotransferase, partial [Niastella sp.]
MNKICTYILSIMLGMAFAGCTNGGENLIREIGIGLHDNNELKIQVDVTTTANTKVFAEYWADSDAGKKYISSVSDGGMQHALVLGNIIPQTGYSFRIITGAGKAQNVSKTYTFKSRVLPMWLQDQFKYSCSKPELLPPAFNEGFLLMNKREAPGLLYIVDTKGQLRWYHMVDGTGVKVAHFTKDTSIIAILGKSDEPTSYGSELLEINLLGDTLLHLKKGQDDLRYTIHHEIIKNNEGNIVTIYEDPRIMDLSRIGGNKQDTVNGDGILVLNHAGKKIWQWSVFDACDPLADADLLKHKRDWMHANSLSYDTDGNYLLSFYNLGQVWKVDAHTGKVWWKLGKGGTVPLKAGTFFSQSHAVHINNKGSLMLFDNGVDKKQSGVFAYNIQANGQAATVD